MLTAQLRAKLAVAKKDGWGETEVFLAEKLVTLSGGASEDVFELASAFTRSNQHRRALHTLRLYESEKTCPRCQILAAECLLHLQEYQDCLELLKVPVVTSHSPLPQLDSQRALVRGRAFDALDHKDNAAHWYKESVRCDKYNIAAIDRLITGCLITSAEADRFIRELMFLPEDEWLKQMYLLKIPFTNPEIDRPLESSVDALACQARDLLLHNHAADALRVSQTVYQRDPFHPLNTLIHICALTHLYMANDLHLLGHNLTQQRPDAATSWFAVGAYYYVTHNLPKARQFFQRATKLDPREWIMWLSLGNCCVAEEESDQAILSFRTATRLFPGSPLPWIALSKEYLRARNIPLAAQHVAQASRLDISNREVLHQHGVVLYENGRYAEAEAVFRTAIDAGDDGQEGLDEVTLFNLGQCLRKLRRYDEALSVYHRARAIDPRNPTTHCAIGFTHHLMGGCLMAVEWYHKALSLKPSDSTCALMLKQALNDLYPRTPHDGAEP